MEITDLSPDISSRLASLGTLYDRQRYLLVVHLNYKADNVCNEDNAQSNLK